MMRMKKSQWQEVIDLNLTGVFLCTQVFKICNLFSICICLNLSFLAANHFCMLLTGCIQNYDEKEKGNFKVLCHRFGFFPIIEN